MSTRERLPRGELNGFLDQGSELHGELRFEQTFRVEGRFGFDLYRPGGFCTADLTAG